MADRTMQSGDTWPPLKGLAADEDGPVDLTTADSISVVCKFGAGGGATVIAGPVDVIDPPEVDGDETYNWQYEFEDQDTDIPGTYNVRLIVVWDAGATPPSIESFPNAQAGSDRLIIEPAVSV
jgi:hypothetical protein